MGTWVKRFADGDAWSSVSPTSPHYSRPLTSLYGGYLQMTNTKLVEPCFCHVAPRPTQINAEFIALADITTCARFSSAKYASLTTTK